MYAFAREPSETFGNLHSQNYKIVPTGVVLKLKTLDQLVVGQNNKYKTRCTNKHKYEAPCQ